ncbi:MAG: DUF167 domain-containing protein [Zetaproteobacteria bacterium]|nr:MAG: DUF167 domain-containing protein [Zetaproteobacteria bacterium]
MIPEGVCDCGSDGLYLRVHAQPGARNPGVRGLHGNAVKVAVREAAEGGKANRAVAQVVAEGLGVTVRDVTVRSGRTARAKRLFIAGDAQLLRRRLLDWLGLREG